MTFRARLMVAFAAATAIPLIVIAIGVRREMDRRLTAQYESRVTALAAVSRADLARQSAALGDRLASLGGELADDDRFRLAAVQGITSQRPYLLDYAARAMRLTGLSMLQIQDSAGRILSSGHFRNEYDRLEPDLPRLLSAAPGGAALVDARTPEGPLRVFARSDSVTIGGRRFALVGGITADRAFFSRLAPDSDLSIALVAPDSVRARDTAAVVAELPIPFIAPSTGGLRAVRTAQLVISHRASALDDLRRSVNQWFIAATIITVAGALVLAAWLSARVSRPLSDLAEQTTHVDFDRPGAMFRADRDDEIGALARVMNTMLRRLAAGAARARDAERRAALGDLARQVNHDVKNGLAPIRHVLRHLAQVERDDPDRLAAVFSERRPTLDASVAYLDTLARNYARLTPRLDTAPCDPNEIVRGVAASAAAPSHARLVLELDERAPAARADALVLRRIVSNLVSNAVDALDGRDGTVTIATARRPDGSVFITVSDTGRGMTREQLDRAFDDFYTTKPDGTGLGLSIVRRLITDLQGTLSVDTAPGAGTRITLTCPAASTNVHAP